MPKTDSDIQELKDFIHKEFAEIKQDLHEIKLSQAKLEGKLDAWKPAINKIPDLAEKTGELKNWRQIALIVIAGSISAVISWLLKSN